MATFSANITISAAVNNIRASGSGNFNYIVPANSYIVITIFNTNIYQVDGHPMSVSSADSLGPHYFGPGTIISFTELPGAPFGFFGVLFTNTL